jgi:hypothetical protein
MQEVEGVFEFTLHELTGMVELILIVKGCLSFVRIVLFS